MDQSFEAALLAVVQSGGASVLSDPRRFRNMMADALGASRASHRDSQAVMIALIENGAGQMAVTGPLLPEQRSTLALDLADTHHAMPEDIDDAITALETTVVAAGLRPAHVPLRYTDDVRDAVAMVLDREGIGVLDEPVRFRNLLSDALGSTFATERVRSVLVGLAGLGIAADLRTGEVSDSRREEFLSDLRSLNVDDTDLTGAVQLFEEVVPSPEEVTPAAPTDVDSREPDASLVTPSIAAGATPILDDVTDAAEASGRAVTSEAEDGGSGFKGDPAATPYPPTTAAGMSVGATTGPDTNSTDLESLDDAELQKVDTTTSEGPPTFPTVAAGLPPPASRLRREAGDGAAGKRRRGPLLAAASVVAILVAGGLAFASTRGGDEAATTTETVTSESTTAPTTATPTSQEPTPEVPEETPSTDSTPSTTGPTTTRTAPTTTTTSPPPPPTVTLTATPPSLRPGQTSRLSTSTTGSVTTFSWADPTGSCRGSSPTCFYTCPGPGTSVTVSVLVSGPSGTGGPASVVMTCNA